MKLIYLDSGRFPTQKAHGLQIVKMCEAFASAGADVELVVASRRNPIKADVFEYYSLQRVFKIKKLPSLDLVGVIPKWGTWVSRLSFIISAKIYLAFKKYDILYFREHTFGLFFRNFLLESHALPNRITALDGRVWQQAKKIIVLTSFIKNRLVRAGVPETKILVAADAVDLEKFRVESEKLKVREKLNLPRDKKIIGYVGSFHTIGMEKGLSTILESLRILRGKFENIVFMAVGGTSSDIAKYSKLAKSLRVGELTIFPGHVPAVKVPSYLSAADVLVMAYPQNDHYSYFMSPIKMFEYMSSGRPIVTTDLPSIREILDEETAVFAQPNNPESLATGIEKVFRDTSLAARISAKALEVVKAYTWLNRARKILDFLL